MSRIGLLITCVVQVLDVVVQTSNREIFAYLNSKDTVDIETIIKMAYVNVWVSLVLASLDRLEYRLLNIIEILL